MKIIRISFLFLLMTHCFSIQDNDRILLLSDGIILQAQKPPSNISATRLSKDKVKMQKCYVYNTFYPKSIFVSYYEFGEYIKHEFPQANGIEDLKVDETIRSLDGNTFYSIFFVENCFYYSGIPVVIQKD